MSFTYHRTVYFHDTDAAGVVYFAHVLSMCHEAYEASLAASGIDLKLFFTHSTQAIPITHASVDFFRPMFCGDQLVICLTPQQLGNHEFEVSYQIMAVSSEQLLAKSLTRHVCINPVSRTRTLLPEAIGQWLGCWSSSSSD